MKKMYEAKADMMMCCCRMCYCQADDLTGYNIFFCCT